MPKTLDDIAAMSGHLGLLGSGYNDTETGAAVNVLAGFLRHNTAPPVGHVAAALFSAVEVDGLCLAVSQLPREDVLSILPIMREAMELARPAFELREALLQYVESLAAN